MDLLTVLSWVATVIILISFLFDGMKLRLINGIGALVWTFWGLGVEEYSVVFLNACIIGIHLVHYRIYKKKKDVLA